MISLFFKENKLNIVLTKLLHDYRIKFNFDLIYFWDLHFSYMYKNMLELFLY